MIFTELICKLTSLRIQLSLENGRLVYKAPKGSLTSELRKEILTHKTELISLLQENQYPQSLHTIQPVPRTGETYPLSLAQEVQWSTLRHSSLAKALNRPMIFHIEGELNATALKQSIQHITKRHEIFRTSFVESDSTPLQVIRPHRNLPFPVIDLQQLSDAAQQVQTKNIIHKETTYQFAIHSEPLIRTLLIKTQAFTAILILNIHAMVFSDSESSSLFFQEIREIYKSLVTNNPVSLNPLPIQYADFACWQRQWLTGDTLQQYYAYWEKQLGGNIPKLTPPKDMSLPADKEHGFLFLSETLDKELNARLRTLSLEKNATLFMIFMAALNILIHRLTGTKDIVIGCNIAGRNHADTENLIGIFFNTLAMRNQVPAQASFNEFLSQIRKTALDAYSHQDLPLPAIIKRFQPDKYESGENIFDVIFAYHNISSAVNPELYKTKVKQLMFCEATSAAPLTVYATEKDTEIYLDILYERSIFPKHYMSMFLGNFIHLLEVIATSPNLSISAYQAIAEDSNTLTSTHGPSE